MAASWMTASWMAASWMAASWMAAPNLKSAKTPQEKLNTWATLACCFLVA